MEDYIHFYDFGRYQLKRRPASLQKRSQSALFFCYEVIRFWAVCFLLGDSKTEIYKKLYFELLIEENGKLVPDKILHCTRIIRHPISGR